MPRDSPHSYANRPRMNIGSEISSSLLAAATAVLALGGKVLILGPHGSGLEFLADVLHYFQWDPESCQVLIGDGSRDFPQFPSGGRAIVVKRLRDTDTYADIGHLHYLLERADLILRVTDGTLGLTRRATQFRRD